MIHTRRESNGLGLGFVKHQAERASEPMFFKRQQAIQTAGGGVIRLRT
jgi:hypothetical protein